MQDLVTEIRNRVDIVDIINERIPLVSRGKNYFGVCPFHDDSHPSLSVSRDKQIYRCFSCGAGGNVFNFLMNYEHKTFKEVLKDLGDRIGLDTKSLNVNSSQSKYDNLYQIYKLSHKYFQNNLYSEYGRSARKYLENRGFSEDIIKEFGVGLSLAKQSDLTKLLMSKEYDVSILNQIGLSNDMHDVYTNRIMFPLYDPSGHIVGFSGRIYDIESKSKYVNTKETVIFKKGNCLYHYHIARDHCSRENSVILVEGFMDVIRLATIGLRNTVALMGTALTKEQINLLTRLSKNIIVCLDGDEPGKNAAKKVGEALFEIGIVVKMVTLPNDDDPDSFILKEGGERFLSLVKSAVTYSDYKINLLKENVNFQSEEELSRYINNVLKEASKINDSIRVEIILKKLAKDYNIGYNTLEKRFQELSNGKIIQEKPKQPDVIKVNKSLPTKKRKDKYQMAMEQIIYFMLNNDWVIDQVEQEKIVCPTNEERLLTSEIIYFYRKNRHMNVADFFTFIQDKKNLLQLLNSIVSSNYQENVDKKILFSYFKVVKDYSISQQKKRLEKLMREENNQLEKVKIAEQIRKLKLGDN